MKKLLLIIFIIPFVISCKKAIEPEAVKTINDAFIYLERPLISKNDSVYVGVRYFKDYVGVDKITLSINGINGQAQGPKVDQFTGTNYLFRFPAFNNTSDLKLLLTIDNNQSILTKEKTLKVIENYELETVWNSFDYNYIIQALPIMSNAKSLNFIPFVSINAGPDFTIGSYYEKPIPNASIVTTKFIPAINGVYFLNYTDNKVLENLTVFNGNVDEIQSLSFDALIKDMETKYGQSTVIGNNIIGQRVVRFSTNRLQIDVYERRIYGTYRGIATVVSLK